MIPAMRGISAIDLVPLAAGALRLAVAFVLGGLIGAERQFHQRIAGLRTNVLVALGAAAFVDIGMQLHEGDGGARVVGQVVTGIGFLGAGAIMKEGVTVHGLNTAATVWCSAAVGTVAGAGRLADAALLTVFVLGCNVLLRPMIRQVGTRYIIHLTAAAEQTGPARSLLAEAAAATRLLLQEITVQNLAVDQVELAARLAWSPGAEAELNRVVAGLSASPLVIHAAWHSDAGGRSG